MATTNSVPKGSFQPDSEVHITYEDQQKINKFARQNARLEDLKDELKTKQKEFQNLDDACDEVLLLEGEDYQFSLIFIFTYMLGEVFVCHDVDETQQMLLKAKTKLQDDIENLQTNCDRIKQVMAELKAQLYAKFGNNINLEAEDD
uniref:Prefoldin subunit 4 n=1 Tax=Strigamia maritima TaxID=126957 RepID=T1J251_STRMM